MNLWLFYIFSTACGSFPLIWKRLYENRNFQRKATTMTTSMEQLPHKEQFPYNLFSMTKGHLSADVILTYKPRVAKIQQAGIRYALPIMLSTGWRSQLREGKEDGSLCNRELACATSCWRMLLQKVKEGSKYLHLGKFLEGISTEKMDMKKLKSQWKALHMPILQVAATGYHRQRMLG